MRWAAQSATKAGYRVISMDLFGDLDTRAASDRCEIISTADQADPDKLSATINRIAHQEQAAVVWVGGFRAATCRREAIRPISNEELAKLALTAGFRFPESVPFGAKRPSIDTRWLVKESHSTGGLGLRFYDRVQCQPIPANAVLQRWIPGRAWGLVAIADGHGVTLLGMTRSIYQRWGDFPFVYAGSRTIANATAIPWKSMRTLCERIADSRGLRGLFNLDWIHDRRDQWWLLEVNERPSASCEVIERALHARGVYPEEASLMRMHLAAILPIPARSRLALPQATHPAHRPSTPREILRVAEKSQVSASIHVKRIVYSRHEGHVYLSSLASRWRANETIFSETGASSGVQLADIPQDGTPVQRGQPIATLLVDNNSSSSRTPLSATLHQAIRQIQTAVR